MVDPTLTISIDRTDLSLSPLLFSAADDGTLWGIAAWQAPGLQARLIYAGDSPFLHGSTAVSATWQQGLMTFDATPEVATEADLRTAVAELRAAIGRLAFSATVTINGRAETWACDMGNITEAAREFEDLRDLDPTYTVSIPVYPVAS